MLKAEDRYFVIMAGGRGERFWPVSREAQPKQLISLLGQRSFLQQTVDRVQPLAPAENIFVITNRTQAKQVRAQLPELPGENVLAEPCGRDTCAAVTLGAAVVGHRNENGVMAVLPADHVISDTQSFRQVLLGTMARAAVETQLMTIGIQPTEPSTGYGYILLGKRQGKGDTKGPVFHQVDRFIEKPDLPTAKRFLRSARYHWNAGMFVWSYRNVLEALQRYQPEMADACVRWKEALARPRVFSRMLTQEYPSLTKVSIDYALMEKVPNVWAAEANFDWDDLGSWTALARHLTPDEAGNCAVGDLVQVDACNNVVFDARKKTKAPRPIALVGIQDCIVVLTDDATMVASKGHAQQIKTLVQKLAASKQYRPLL